MNGTTTTTSPTCPLREPLLEDALPSCRGGERRAAGRRGRVLLRRYPLIDSAHVPRRALLLKEEHLVLGAAAGGGLPVLSVGADAIGAGIQPDDRLVYADGQRVRTPQEWAAVLDKLRLQQHAIPSTEEQAEETAAAAATVELRLLRRHHAYIEEVVLHPQQNPQVLEPASPPDSVLGLLLASGGCLLGAAAAASSRRVGSRSRQSSWSSTASDEEDEGGGEEAAGMPSLQQQPQPTSDALPRLPPYARWAREPGAAALLDAAVGSLPLAAFPFLWYEIATADEASAGLSALARRFKVSVDTLRRDNRRHFPLGEPARLRPGMLLRLRNAEFDPDVMGRCAASAALSSSYCPPASSVGGVGCPDRIPEESKDETISSSNSSKASQRRRLRRLRGVHMVERGCTIGVLTERYGMAEGEIRRRNRHAFPTGVPSNEVLREGQGTLLKVELVLGEDEEPPQGFHVYSEEAFFAATTEEEKEYHHQCCAGGSFATTTASLTSSSGSSSNSSICGSGGSRGHLFPLVDVGAATGGSAEEGHPQHHGFV